MLNRFTSDEGVAINVFSNGIPGVVFHHNDGGAAIESIVQDASLDVTEIRAQMSGQRHVWIDRVQDAER